MATILPTIFLAVAAFLTHMVLDRLIAIERSEIGLLKAFGYRNRDDRLALRAARDRASACSACCSAGSSGCWLGLYHTRLYAEFYRFPFLHLPAERAVVPDRRGVVSLGSALLGALARRARARAALPPAEAMRPPSPPLFRARALRRAHRAHRLDQPTRMILLRRSRAGRARSFVTRCRHRHGGRRAGDVDAVARRDRPHGRRLLPRGPAPGRDASGSANRDRARSSADLARLPGVLTTEPMRAWRRSCAPARASSARPCRACPADQQLYRVYDAQRPRSSSCRPRGS